MHNILWALDREFLDFVDELAAGYLVANELGLEDEGRRLALFLDLFKLYHVSRCYHVLVMGNAYFKLDCKWRLAFLGAIDNYPPCDIFLELIRHNKLLKSWQ